MLLSMMLEIAKIRRLLKASRDTSSASVRDLGDHDRAGVQVGRALSPLGLLGIVVHLFQLGLYVRNFVFQGLY
jgi:hypothetical protein